MRKISKTIILASGGLVVVFLNYSYKVNKNGPREIIRTSISGSSLSGIIEDGTQVDTDLNYYKSNPILKNDIVLIEYEQKLYSKIIVAVEGDSVEIQNHGKYSYLLINGNIAINYKKIPYELNSEADRRWRFFISSTKGNLPSDHFIVFGTNPHGSTDSTKYGPIKRSQILGKIFLRHAEN